MSWPSAGRTRRSGRGAKARRPPGSNGPGEVPAGIRKSIVLSCGSCTPAASSRHLGGIRKNLPALGLDFLLDKPERFEYVGSKRVPWLMDQGARDISFPATFFGPPRLPGEPSFPAARSWGGPENRSGPRCRRGRDHSKGDRMAVHLVSTVCNCVSGMNCSPAPRC